MISSQLAHSLKQHVFCGQPPDAQNWPALTSLREHGAGAAGAADGQRQGRQLQRPENLP